VLHPLFLSVCQELDRADVRWCLLRVPADLAAPEGDIDLLVAGTDVKYARRALTALGFVQMPRPGTSLHFLSYHRPTDRWLWLHVVTTLAFGPYHALRTGAEVGCLTRAVACGPMTVLAPDDAFWALLLHCLLDKGGVAERHRARLRTQAECARTDTPLARLVGAVCPPTLTPERLVECARQGDWEALESFARALEESWLRRQPIAAREKLAYRAAHLRDSLRTRSARRGLSVAVLGPDGAGKSTLCAALASSFVLPVRSMYMGLTGGALRYADRVRIPGVRLLLRLCVHWARYLTARFHQARGRLVVIDRYVYDAVAPHPQRLGLLRRASRWVDGRSCPPPDMTVVLDVPGAQMYARKGAYTPEMLEEWRQHFLTLGRRVPGLEVVDATRPAAVVQADVTERIWLRYAARWRGARSHSVRAHG
jgi:thymidylate kinase